MAGQPGVGLYLKPGAQDEGAQVGARVRQGQVGVVAHDGCAVVGPGGDEVDVEGARAEAALRVAGTMLAVLDPLGDAEPLGHVMIAADQDGGVVIGRLVRVAPGRGLVDTRDRLDLTLPFQAGDGGAKMSGAIAEVAADRQDHLSHNRSVTVVIGVLNVTPDSFSDGGLYQDFGAAVAHAVEMRDQGAYLIDVGGESTRPGAERVDADTEIKRVVPVIAALHQEGVPTSVDTSRASVAAAALEAGATIVNDVSGGLADADMRRVVAQAGCPYVIMHWRGHSRDMQSLASYGDVVAEVREELSRRVDEALAAGIARDRIIIDPGLGFAKTAAHNWLLSRHLDEFVGMGFPVLFAASRKSYLGALLDGRPAARRDVATAVTSVLAAQAGVWGVRVHDVQATMDALKVWQAWIG
jgi:dihydropteroate synthase